MRLNTKIKAFTLTEVMVVIVLSAIVAGLAFSILGIVQKNMQGIAGNYEYRSQLQSLEVALTIDINKHTAAQWSEVDNQLILSSPIAEKRYTFSTDSIFSGDDKFLVTTKTKTFYFEGNEVQTGQIDAVKLTFDKTTELHRIFVFKHNDPTIHF